MTTLTQTAINELLSAGLTEAEIAKEVGVTQPTINRIRHGVHADPRSSIVFAILDLHKKHMPITQEASSCKS